MLRPKAPTAPGYDGTTARRHDGDSLDAFTAHTMRTLCSMDDPRVNVEPILAGNNGNQTMDNCA